VRSIAARIKRERVMWGMTQEDLAEATGIDRDKIAKIETGQRQVAVEELPLLARAFELDASDLVAEPQPLVYHRLDLGRPETKRAINWFERCIDNSLFVRQIGHLYDR
jgi:transcriptional regulator with XRE-family HTH domain